MLLPVGNFVIAVVARQVDEEYVEWGWYTFGVGALLWLALWPVTFLMVRIGCFLHDVSLSAGRRDT